MTSASCSTSSAPGWLRRSALPRMARPACRSAGPGTRTSSEELLWLMHAWCAAYQGARGVRPWARRGLARPAAAGRRQPDPLLGWVLLCGRRNQTRPEWELYGPSAAPRGAFGTDGLGRDHRAVGSRAATRPRPSRRAGRIAAVVTAPPPGGRGRPRRDLASRPRRRPAPPSPPRTALRGRAAARVPVGIVRL
ncbi:hypothetical protein HBB16_06425 [Pseudonocardia sp. MCCB 268]|nr:hypothetical protein [Pseudonocardia cytotoxica]